MMAPSASPTGCRPGGTLTHQSVHSLVGQSPLSFLPQLRLFFVLRLNRRPRPWSGGMYWSDSYQYVRVGLDSFYLLVYSVDIERIVEERGPGILPGPLALSASIGNVAKCFGAVSDLSI